MKGAVYLVVLAAVSAVNPSPADQYPSNGFSLTPSRPARPSYSKKLNNFDIELLQKTAESTSGNFMISPASIKSVLIMVLEGSRGNSAEELRGVLRLPPDQNDIRNLLKSYMSELQVQTEGVLVESANKVFVSNRYRIKQDYERVLNNYYNAKVDLIDFSQAHIAANVINNWVSGSTHNHIPELVDAASLDSNTVLMLANAMYFKGTWEASFDENLTKDKCFYINGNCIMTPTMENEDEFKYALIDDSISAQAIEMPYQGGKFSMLIVLPTERDGLKNVLRDFSHTAVETILNQLETTEVQLSVPKFTIDYNEDMTSILKKLGIRDLFSSAANLTGMIYSGTPHIDSVAHRTRIEVNEKGSIAAAATGAMVVPLMGGTTARMTIDHPFIFLIRNTESGAILFAGRVQQPDQSAIINNVFNKPTNQNINPNQNFHQQPTSNQNYGNQPQRNTPSVSRTQESNFNQPGSNSNYDSRPAAGATYNSKVYPTGQGQQSAYNGNQQNLQPQQNYDNSQ